MYKYNAPNRGQLAEASALLVVSLLPVLVLMPRGEVGHLAVVIMLEIFAVYGLIAWVLQRRQRRLRQQTIEELQGMLKDIVNNQLAAIALNTELARPSNEQYLQRVYQSIDAISHALDHLSDESLRDWQIVYSEIEDPKRAA